MTDRPILFNTEMVKAILADRKTQTRRVVKPQPKYQELGSSLYRFLPPCPYGRPGDLLWVRETWQGQNQYGQWWHEVERHERPLHNWAWTNPVAPAYDGTPPRWLPSIHMPRIASRITLRVTAVWVERVQDIRDNDAIAEGIICDGSKDLTGITTGSPVVMFAKLWDSINAKRGYSWQSNPWVWVVEFERVTP